MIKLFQNMSTTNDGEQHKDNHINITQYFESNKDGILYLTEKHYENLVKALANNVMNTTVDSSTPTLSLPSSSTFLGPYNQSDTSE